MIIVFCLSYQLAAAKAEEIADFYVGYRKLEVVVYFTIGDDVQIVLNNSDTRTCLRKLYPCSNMAEQLALSARRSTEECKCGAENSYA